MPLMTSLYTGVTGLKASQTGINTTAHNLSNVYTEGYVRQQISYADLRYSNYGNLGVNTKQVGFGVVESEIRHIRDLLLDKAYRQEAGRENYYSSKYEAIEEVENILGELNSVAFQDSLEELWESISEMAKSPDSTTSRAGLVMSADEFVTRVKAVNDQLEAYQTELNKKVTDNVDQINSLGEKIHSLNMKISSIEASGIESANDLRDQRDVALDKLSELINISYNEDENSIVSVRAEGQEFITKGGVFKMGTAQLDTDKDSNYLTPVWPHIANTPVFNLSEEIATSKRNDIGLLKGILSARGDYEADYTDIPVAPVKPVLADFPDAASYNTALDNYWNVSYPAYQEEVTKYNTTVSNSVIMKSQALFDQLINKIVTMVNDALCPNTDTTIPAGTTYTIAKGTNYNSLQDNLKNQLTGLYTLDDDGNFTSDVSFTLGSDITLKTLDMSKTSYGNDDLSTPGNELFSRLDNQGRYTLLKYTDVSGEEKSIYAYNPYNYTGRESLYNSDNIEVNKVVKDDYSFLPFSDAEGANNLKLAESIVKNWADASVNLDPNNMTKKDFDDYYSSMVSIIANDGYIYNAVSKNQQTVVDSINSQRSAVTGVSSEEELTNLIKFQNAYGANSRYINAVAEMIDTLINRTGL